MSNLYENVKVGDRFIVTTRHDENVCVVTKVTKTRFECGGRPFLKKDGSEYGRNFYYRAFIKPASEEDIARLNEMQEKKEISKMLKDYKYESLDIETLKKIKNIVEGVR